MSRPANGAASRARAFVGRDRELAELEAGLSDALEGRGRLFLIAGEPGIGKSGLSEQVAALAAARGFRVAWGHCWEGGGAPPYWPWAQVIRAVADGYDDATLAAHLGNGAATIAQLAPAIAERVGVSTGSAGQLAESDAARFYLFEAIAEFFRRAASAEPLVLIFEDLHAADEPTLLLLAYLARDLRGTRRLLLGTFRDVAAGRPAMGEMASDLVRVGQLLSLRGLDRDEVGSLIQALLGRVPSDRQVAAFHETTEGNPLFIREAVRLLALEGASMPVDPTSVPIPGTVRALIQQRLAPLSAEAVQVLSAAAVVGRGFDLALVGPACGLPIERVLTALSEASELGVVVLEPGAAGLYRFSHSLMREVIYETLPLAARAQLHRAVGEAIERVYGTEAEAHVAELARHFAEVAAAGAGAKALEYARRAGERAMEAYAYEEAIAEYQRALRALRFAGPDESQRCDLLLRLGAAQVRASRFREAKETHLEAAEVSRRLDAPEQFARAALGFGQPQVEGGFVDRQLVDLLNEALDRLSPEDSPSRARLLARLSVELTFSDETEQIATLSRQAVEMARRLGDAPTLGETLDARWMAVWGPEGLRERAALADEALRLALETGNRELELLARSQRATSALEVGDIRALETEVAIHSLLADELRMPVHQWTAATMRATCALLRGDFSEAERLAEAAAALQPGRPNTRWAYLNSVSLLRWEQGRLGEMRETWQALVQQFPRAGFIRGWLTLADLQRGDVESARRGLRTLAEQIPTRRRSGIWLPGPALAALVAAEVDEPEAARRLYAVLRPYAEHVIVMPIEHPVACFGSVSLYLGILAGAAGQDAEASSHFDTAIRVHDRLGARPLLARTRCEYARALLRRGEAGDRGRALELLNQAESAARAMSLVQLGERIAALREIPLVDRATDLATTPAVPAGDLFKREGAYWTVSYDGSVVRMRDSKGMRLLARLLAHAGREFHVTDLEAVAAASTPLAGAGARSGPGDPGTRPDLGDAGALLDPEAKAAYRARLDDLREEIEEAERFNDPTRAEKARREQAYLIRELARAVGLGGRDRRAVSHAERARLNVTRAIRAAMAGLAREHPALGRHLEATIRTGRYCSYTPDPRGPTAWEF